MPLNARTKMWWKLAGLALLAGASLFVLLAPMATLDVTVELPPAGSVRPPKIDGDDSVKVKLLIESVVGLIALAVLCMSVWAGWRVVRNLSRSEPN